MTYTFDSKNDEGLKQALKIQHHKEIPYLYLGIEDSHGNSASYTIRKEDLHELIGALLHIQARTKKEK